MSFPTEEQIAEAKRVLAAVEVQKLQIQREAQGQLAQLIQEIKGKLQEVRTLRDEAGLYVDLSDIVYEVNCADNVNDEFIVADWNGSSC